MKKRIAMLLAVVMLMMAVCAVTAAAEAEEPEFAGVYCRTWSEEIAGTVAERNAYIVMNRDGTGYLFAQGIGRITWDENQITEEIGVSYKIELTEENGFVNLLVYDFGDTPNVFEKIEKLPEDMEAMLAEDFPMEYVGVFCHAFSEEIGGAVVERNIYMVLNEDHTGCWIVQAPGMVTWEAGQLTDNFGLTYTMTLEHAEGNVNLLVYEFGDTPNVYEKIEQLPTEVEELLAAG